MVDLSSDLGMTDRMSDASIHYNPEYTTEKQKSQTNFTQTFFFYSCSRTHVR